MYKNDLVGKRFGKLVCVSYDKTKRKWLCRCDCGNENYVARRNLLWDHVTSCGCQGKRFIDIAGNRYGKLVALQYDRAKKKWLCRCDCGNTVLAQSSMLRNGTKTCCSCESRQKHLIDLLHKKFGMLRVVARVPIPKHECKPAVWHCLCECGKTIDVYSKSLRRNVVTSCRQCKKNRA